MQEVSNKIWVSYGDQILMHF